MTCYICDAKQDLAFVGDVPQCRRCRGVAPPAQTDANALAVVNHIPAPPLAPGLFRFVAPTNTDPIWQFRGTTTNHTDAAWTFPVNSWGG